MMEVEVEQWKRDDKGRKILGNNNKHGTWSRGQRISNSTLTCRVEFFSSSSSSTSIIIINILDLHHRHRQPPSPSPSSSTSITIPPSSLGWLGVTQQRWTWCSSFHLLTWCRWRLLNLCSNCNPWSRAKDNTLCGIFIPLSEHKFYHPWSRIHLVTVTVSYVCSSFFFLCLIHLLPPSLILIVLTILTSNKTTGVFIFLSFVS